MVRDSAFLCDIYDAIKIYVSKAEQGIIAEDLVRIFDEYGFTEGFMEEPTINSKLKKAIRSLYGETDDDGEAELNFSDDYGCEEYDDE
jgi:hypothetical protein